MTNGNDNISICRELLNDAIFKDDKFDKVHAWLDLLFLANRESKSIFLRGTQVELGVGDIIVSLRDLGSRWGWGHSKVNSFLTKLADEGMIIYQKGKLVSVVNIKNLDSYFSTGTPIGTPIGTPSGTRNYSENQMVNIGVGTPTGTPVGTHSGTPKSTGTPIGTRNYDENQSVTHTPGTPIGTPFAFKETKGKETKKEKISPTPPIKEINKEKEKKETFPTPNVVGCSTHAHTHVHESETDLVLTNETTAKEKPQKKKQEKEYSLTWRARLKFSEFYKERYGEEKYWKVAEMNALSQLLKQIKYSRLHREVPLAVDDDSMLSAFVELLNNICTPWILNNFLVTNINSKYDTIIQDIKNKRYGTSVNTSNVRNAGSNNGQNGQTLIEHQKQDCYNDLLELERKIARGEIENRFREYSEAETELPDV